MIEKVFNLEEGPCKETLLLEFKENYLSTKDFIRKAIYWMVRSEIVDDLVQDSYAKAWKKYSYFKRDSSFKTWIYKIAMNTTYDYLRRNKKELEIKEKDTVGREGPESELHDLVSKGLLILTDKHREVFILYYKFGYTSLEISKLLNLSEGTVKSRLHYAKGLFIDFLKNNGVDK